MKRLTLKEARDRRGLTQVQLATLANMEQSHISMIERGVKPRPELATMRKLSRALAMDAVLVESGLVFEEKQP